MKKIVVYKLIFPNNKSYIGITKDLKRRLSEHKLKAKKGDNLPISNAIAMYKNFDVSILSQHFKKTKAYQAEMFFIKHHNTLTPNGYNVCEGGPGVKGYNKERFNLKRSINENQLRASKETALNVLSIYVNKKKVALKCSNGITYESINDACRKLNLNATCVIRVLKGKQKQTKGYYFEAIDVMKYEIEKKKQRRKSKLGINKNIRRLKERSKTIIREDGVIYSSCEHAAKKLKRTPEAVRACLKGRSKTCAGFKLTYLNNDSNMNDNNMTGLFKKEDK